MFQKKETRTLLLALTVASGFVGVCLWGLTQAHWFQKSFSYSTQSSSQDSLLSPQSNSSENQTFAQVPNVPKGWFNYGGGISWNPIHTAADPIIEKAWPQFHLRYILPPSKSLSSTTGIEMLLDNQLAFSVSSRSLKEEEHLKAERKGFPLKEIPVAIHAVAVVVNPQLEIKGLTVPQLRDIYQGKITNWEQLGGPNVPIIPYSRTTAAGTVDFFVKNVLEDANFGINVEFLTTTTSALQKVSENLGGIYYASAPKIVHQCSVKPIPIGFSFEQLIPPYQKPLISEADCPNQRNQLNQAAFRTGEYPITKRLFVIIKQNGQADQKAGEAYANLLLTKQGQDLLEEAGYTRIKY